MLDRRSAAAPLRPIDSTLDFLRLLWSIEHHLQSTSKLMESRLGITGPQRLVLKVIAQFPGISAKQVADVVRLHPSTITGILQRLTKKGLVLRAQDPIDTRRIRLRIQPNARRFTRRARGTVEHAVERALKQMSPTSVRAAREVLAAITTALESEAPGSLRRPLQQRPAPPARSASNAHLRSFAIRAGGDSRY